MHKVSGHTLLGLEDLEKIGKMAGTMNAFVNSLEKFKIPDPLSSPEILSGMPESFDKLMANLGIKVFQEVPENLDSLLKRPYKVTTTFKGGET